VTARQSIKEKKTKQKLNNKSKTEQQQQQQQRRQRRRTLNRGGAPPSNGGVEMEVAVPVLAAQTPPQPASSSLFGRLRRTAVGAVSSPRVNVRLNSVSLLGNASPTDERQLDSGHL